jgi:scyllo-inositol 2-dehydrogenase (NADP+)
MIEMKWALIGYGGMGQWHVDKLRTMPGEFQIAGVYDILPERNQKAQENGLHAYQRLEDLLADDTVELVTIATPNDTHMPLAVAAMQAGKHVICEKPVALSTQELTSMAEVSRQTRRLLTVHQNRRWDEDFLIVKKLLRENALGAAFNIESRVHGSRGVPGDWRNKRAHGGGMILDWGVHLLDQLLQLTSEAVVAVSCYTTHVTNDEVDDGFKAILTFEGGWKAEVEVGTSHFISLPRWYICGENGTAIIRDWSLNGEIVKVSDWEARDAVPVVTAAGLTKTMAPRTEETIQTYPLPDVRSDVRDFYRNVKSAIRGEAEPLVTQEQMLRVMRLMEALFQSAQNNETVYCRI